MKFKVKNLTQEEAEAYAKAAAITSGWIHASWQARNGKWKWGRVAFYFFGTKRRKVVWYPTGENDAAYE